MRLKEKATIVTGSASGIGKAIAHRFASEGAFATRTASLFRCVLRRFTSSALMPSVQTTIPFTCATARSHVRANAESLHHTSLRPGFAVPGHTQWESLLATL